MSWRQRKARSRRGRSWALPPSAARPPGATSIPMAHSLHRRHRDQPRYRRSRTAFDTLSPGLFFAKRAAMAPSECWLSHRPNLPSMPQSFGLVGCGEKTCRPVSGNQWYRTEFRIIGATNRDLRQEVLESHFRSDLYHRIAVRVCRLPLLSQRPEDILPLTLDSSLRLCPSEELPPLDDGVRDHLLRRTYRGNVRELKQPVTRISQRHVGDGPTIGDLPEEKKSRHRSLSNDWRSESFENAVRHALTLGVRLKEIGQAATDAAIRIAIETKLEICPEGEGTPPG